MCFFCCCCSVFCFPADQDCIFLAIIPGVDDNNNDPFHSIEFKSFHKASKYILYFMFTLALQDGSMPTVHFRHKDR